MVCPQGDGELIAHTGAGEKGLTVSYSTCPTCRGYWMDSFAANFIKLREEKTEGKRTKGPFTCPVCQKELLRKTGDNIPDNISVYHCPENHGYFFPGGELAKFKAAQQAKIDYHKLWSLPLPSVASVLLAGLLLFVLVGAVQKYQQTTSQARTILTAHHVYKVTAQHEVLIETETAVDATVVLHIGSVSTPMTTTDHRTHLLLLPSVPVGTYTYYFTVIISGKSSDSDHFTFDMP